MSDWAGGYVTERDYLRSFHKEMAPSFLRCLLTLRGRRAGDPSRPFRFLDLGCGSGFGCTLLAAANPQGTFIGVDFSPDHVLQAREVAEAAGIGNVRFIEADFADLLERPDGLGEVDILACHGVYTWVSAENRRAIVEIMRRHVATGGIVYLGYNALPGWAPMLPFRHLVQRLAEGRTPSGAQAAIGEARDVFALLAAHDAGYLAGNGPVARWLETVNERKPSYLAHEYLPRPAGAVWHDDVARDLAPAHLTYLGSARLAENFDSINIPEPLRECVADADAQGVGQTVRDLIVNQVFRMDVFTRGATRATAAEADAAFDGLAIALTAPPPEPPAIRTAQGEMRLAEAAGRTVLGLLAEGPATVGDLVARAGEAGVERRQARQVVTALLAGGVALPLATLAPRDEAVAACATLNRVVLDRARAASPLPALASPLLGNGIALETLEQRALAGEWPGAETAEGDPYEMQEHHERAERLRARIPYLQQLGAVPEAR